MRGKASVDPFVCYSWLSRHSYRLGNPMLETEVLKIESDVHVVALKGRLTLGSRLSLLEAEINTLADQGARKIVLDLEHIEYADSAALGVLLHASGAVRAKGGQML